MTRNPLGSFGQCLYPEHGVANLLIDQAYRVENFFIDRARANQSTFDMQMNSNPLRSAILRSIGSFTERIADGIIRHHTPSEFAASARDDMLTDEELASVIHLLEDVNPENLNPGRAYIINHLSFNDPNLKTREGSEFDVERLLRVFTRFDMQIKHVHDGTVADITSVMEEIAESDFRTLSCLVIVIMSHSHDGNIFSAKDGSYSLDYEIMHPILRNRSLKSKLKLIVTEACKAPVDPMLEVQRPRRRPMTIPPEISQVNSYVEGYERYLDPNNGSVFITTLCDNLRRYGLKDDIRDITKTVVTDVQNKYRDIHIPMVMSSRTNRFVFGHYIKD